MWQLLEGRVRRREGRANESIKARSPRSSILHPNNNNKHPLVNECPHALNALLTSRPPGRRLGMEWNGGWRWRSIVGATVDFRGTLRGETWNSTYCTYFRQEYCCTPGRIIVRSVPVILVDLRWGRDGELSHNRLPCVELRVEEVKRAVMSRHESA